MAKKTETTYEWRVHDYFNELERNPDLVLAYMKKSSTLSKQVQVTKLLKAIKKDLDQDSRVVLGMKRK